MMNLINYLKKYKIFIALIFVLLVLVFLNLFLRQGVEEIPEIKPSPSVREKEYDYPIPKKSSQPSASVFQVFSPGPSPIASVSPTFSPSPFPTSSPLESGLTESEVDKQVIEETKRLYPLMEFLPIDNEKYYLAYSAPYELVVLLRSGDKITVENEINGWIRSKDIDPKTHTIIFR